MSCETSTLSNTEAERRVLAEELVQEAQGAGGLAPVDLERFWADQEIAEAAPFGQTIPQVPLGIRMGRECLFGELETSPDYWRLESDHAWRSELSKAYNDKAGTVVGRRLLDESAPPQAEDRYPKPKELYDIFEAANVWHGDSWWLEQSAHNEDELKALLDRVDRRLADLRSFLLPPEWDKVHERLMARGIKPPRYRHQRGPVTFAASIYGAENLIMLLMLNPDLGARLRDTILAAMMGIHEVLDREAGHTAGDHPHGFGFADDNCCLLTPDLYEFFGCPILEAIFAARSPDPGDWRHQHSDSAMGHLLPILSRLNFSQVNFGPTLTVEQIREHMPRTVIQGQLAPFTFSRNEEVNMVAEFLRDFAMARESRGLLFDTAGSINAGSRLTGMRLLMAAIQRYGRY